MISQDNKDVILDIQGLNLNINSKLLLKEFGISLDRKKRIGITGPSGCGKTTFLRSVLSRTLPEGSSAIKFEIGNTQKKIKLGYIPQANSLLPWFTLRKNMTLFLGSSFSESLCAHRINEIANKLDLVKCLDNFPDLLSGGEMQRGLVACAMLAEPDIYLADEPLTEVDLVRKRKALCEWSLSIKNSESSLIIVSHDIETLVFLCDQIIVIGNYPGIIVFSSSMRCDHPRSNDDLTKGEPAEIRRNLLEFLYQNGKG